MNRRGFSMIEILLVLGMVPLVAFAVVYLNQQITKTSSFTNGSLNMLETHQQLQLQMANKAICDSNFSTKIFNNSGIINLNQILDRDGKKITSAGQKTEGLQVTSIQLRPDPAVWTSYLAAKSSIPTTGFAMKVSLVVSFKRAKGSVGASDTAISLPVPMIVGANSNIISCAGVDTASLEKVLSESCAQVGGTYNTTLGTCVLNSVCNSGDPTKPVSQKCLDQQIGTLRTQVTALQTQVSKVPPAPLDQPTLKDCIENTNLVDLRMQTNYFSCTPKGKTAYEMRVIPAIGFEWSSFQKATKRITDPATLALINARIEELYKARLATGK